MSGTKNFVVKNGLTTGNILLNAIDNSITANTASLSANLTVSGTSNLGNVGNVKISGGSSGQVLSTDGNGNLNFTNSVSSSAPMPYYVPVGDILIIPEYYQGLYSYPITVDGDLEVNGILIQVS